MSPFLHTITRNLHQGGPAGYTALAKTIAGLKPDLLLVQECCQMSLYPDIGSYQTVWHPTAHGRWGSGILAAAGVEMQPNPAPLPGFEGWVVKATIWALNREIDVYSVHMPTIKGITYVMTALGLLQALAPSLAGRSVILGGDWNLTLSKPMDNSNLVSPSALVRAVFDELGLVSAWRHCHPAGALARTMRYHFKLDSKPWHIDGYMVSADVVRLIRGCEVLESDEWMDSDHNPVSLALRV